MKNVCLLLKSQNAYLYGANHGKVVDAFLKGGYTFDEVLVLGLEKERSIFEAVKSYKQVCDNLVVVVDGAWIQSLRLLLCEIFPSDIIQGVSTGAGIFTDGERTLFLLSADDRAQGEDYVVKTCIPYLVKKHGFRMERMTLRAVGASAALVFDLLQKVKSMSGGLLAYTHSRKFSEDVIDIFYGQDTSKMLLDDVLRLFAENLGEYIYAYEDVLLEEQVVHLLKLRGRKISVAESFTGGGIAGRLTSVSGASSVYFEGINAYHEGAKVLRLGVDEGMLLSQGAVSEETVYQMATGLLATRACDICIATTGLAGPNSDKSGFPVGLCYLAVGTREKVHVMRYQFAGSREEITQTAINHALFAVYKALKDI